MVGHFGNRACIDDADVRYLSRLHHAYPHLLKLFAYGGGFREVEFAAQCVEHGLLALEY
jgi:hypothetical protein